MALVRGAAGLRVTTVASGSGACSVVDVALDEALAPDVVAARGNHRQRGNPAIYPASHPGGIAVAATDWTDGTATFSSTGGSLDLAPPGIAILSTTPGAAHEN